MSEFRADLHCHSTFSDGSETPAQLIDLAVAKGLGGLSMTDHDTVGAYPEAMVLGKKSGILVLPGIEFSASVGENAVHILGYAFKPDSASIRELCEVHTTRRLQRNQAILDRLEALGLPLSPADLPPKVAQSSIGRPHIAAAMVQKGYASTIQEAFRKYLREGGAAYEAGRRVSVEETIETIHSAGGLAVIAHPHLILDERVIKNLLTLPFDGIEVFYANFPRDRCQRWLDIAQSRRWLMTGGSDFHGSVKPGISLGASYVLEDTFTKLYNHYQDIA